MNPLFNKIKIEKPEENKEIKFNCKIDKDRKKLVCEFDLDEHGIKM